MPFFSVIVPVYNVEKYLGECIDSVLAQTYQDFELILVNDGSKDSSGAICDAYAEKDPRIQVIHKENGGVVSARKMGFRKSCGSYIVNVDSDDYLALDYLSRFYKVITRTNAEMIATRLQLVSETGEFLEALEHSMSEGMYTETQLEGAYNNLLYDFEAHFHNVGCFPWSLCAKAVKRELLETAQLSVPDTIRNGEDCAVMIPAFCKAKSLYISSYCGYFYRQTASSMIRSFNPQAGAQLWYLLEYLSGLGLPIPRRNLVAFSAWMLWNQMVASAQALDSAEKLKFHMQKDYENVISFVLRGMKKNRMTIGILLRMLPVRLNLWRLFWRVYCTK